MSTDLTIFQFEHQLVRTITDEQGNPWFVLRDVLEAMGSKTAANNAKDSIIKGLGDGYSNDYPILDSLGRQQIASFISEPAVTFLVARSNTDRGRKLNRWIHAEVLPQIRKTGSYHMPSFSMEVFQTALQNVIQPMQAQIEHLTWMVENNPRKRPGRVYRSMDIAFELHMSARELHKEASAIGLLKPIRVNDILMWEITDEGERFVKYSSGGTKRYKLGKTYSNSLWWNFEAVRYIKDYEGPKLNVDIPATDKKRARARLRIVH